MRILPLLLLAIPVYAESIVSVTACQIVNITTRENTIDTGPSSCSVMAGAARSVAGLTTNDVLGGLSGQLAIEGHLTSVSAGPNWVSTSFTAQTAGSIITAGRARDGYAKLTYSWSCNNPFFLCVGSMQFGGFTAVGDLPFPICNFSNCDAFVPVALGTTISFSTNTEGECQFPGCLVSEQIAQSRLTFSFYEADRTTPVAFAETPEPVTWCLLIPALWFIRRSRLRPRAGYW